MGKRTNVLIISLLTFFVVVRFGVYGGDNGANLPSRLDVAADRLVAYYRGNAAQTGWQVSDVYAEEKSVAVRVLVGESDRRALAAAPEALRTAGLANLCPVYNHRVWDMFSGGQQIRIDGVDDDGEVFLSHKCARRGV